MAFLERDTIDEDRYDPERGTAYFAEKLHNRAEYYRIKAAIVVVQFENGEQSVFNAFETLDYGLVYVDCTGDGCFERATPEDIEFVDYHRVLDTAYLESVTAIATWYQLDDYDYTAEFPSRRQSWDKVVYLREGRKMILVGAGHAKLDSADMWAVQSEMIQSTEDLWEELRVVIRTHYRRFSEWLEHNGGKSTSPQDWPFVLAEGWVDVEELHRILAERAAIRVLMENLVSAIEESEVVLLYWWEESDSLVKSIETYWE
ncbi:MAG: hypothetical protein ISS55_02585 [Dehalococcoidales bacterium]|nr:hypothetical protein [Dehalococcoidales bacterium]